MAENSEPTPEKDLEAAEVENEETEGEDVEAHSVPDLQGLGGKDAPSNSCVSLVSSVDAD